MGGRGPAWAGQQVAATSARQALAAPSKVYPCTPRTCQRRREHEPQRSAQVGRSWRRVHHAAAVPPRRHPNDGVALGAGLAVHAACGTGNSTGSSRGTAGQAAEGGDRRTQAGRVRHSRTGQQAATMAWQCPQSARPCRAYLAPSAPRTSASGSRTARRGLPAAAPPAAPAQSARPSLSTLQTAPPARAPWPASAAAASRQSCSPHRRCRCCCWAPSGRRNEWARAGGRPGRRGRCGGERQWRAAGGAAAGLAGLSPLAWLLLARLRAQPWRALEGQGEEGSGNPAPLKTLPAGRRKLNRVVRHAESV